MHVEQVERGHGLENIIEPLLIRLEKKELPPKAFGGYGLIDIFIDQHTEKMQIELDNLWLERIGPQQLGQWRLHGRWRD